MADDRTWKTSIGLTAVIDQLGLKIPYPAVRSELVAGTRKTTVTSTQVLEQYPRVYQPPEGILGHLRFALRYEPLDLRVYKAAFQRIERAEIERWVQNEPNGIFARRAWYLYELLTGRALNVDDLTSGRYIDLLDEDLHIVGAPIRVRRQRVFDNLLGNKDYCPFVRRTEKLKADLNKNLGEQAQKLVSEVDPGVLKRAVHYLFTKETKSSFAIEGEAPSKDRTERFVAALMRADKFDPTKKDSLVQLQNAIVDPRYAQGDWRTVQVFIGATQPDYSQEVHFICPKPEDVASLMDGWMGMVAKLLDPENPVHPVCAATAAAFGFVFVHPFLDGNGRIHRFLVHNVLARRNFTPEGVLFPVSAAMLREMSTYDRVLERFSGSIQPFIEYATDDNEQIAVTNDTADLYRYFDATHQAEYLFDCIADAISRDLRAELDFLKFRDAAVKAVMEIVDMPNQRAALIVRLIYQNRGKLSPDKRGMFAELTDEELAKMESAIQSISDAITAERQVGPSAAEVADVKIAREPQTESPQAAVASPEFESNRESRDRVAQSPELKGNGESHDRAATSPELDGNGESPDRVAQSPELKGNGDSHDRAATSREFEGNGKSHDHQEKEKAPETRVTPPTEPPDQI